MFIHFHACFPYRCVNELCVIHYKIYVQFILTKISSKKEESEKNKYKSIL